MSGATTGTKGTAAVGDLEIAYETFGSPEAEPLLLVMGLGGPMTWWDSEFCAQLADAGFYVIRYDNRDAGRSTKIRAKVKQSQVVRAFLGLKVKPPYTVSDMAADGIGLLTALGIDRAHIVGMSMGGMIVQTMAIEHPSRVLSLTSIMSTTGGRLVGWQHPAVLRTILAAKSGEEAYYTHAARMWSLIGSPAYADAPESIRKRAEDTWEYGVSQSGTGRQTLAILTQPNRTRALGDVTAPTLVIHGLSDKMVHVSGGRATAMAIPGSELLLIKGMGHDLPEPLWPTFITAIRRNADRA
ncbi:alpha/beta fold hydrolase [Nocardioides sp. Kera G14]|uniref:alpha/beta fold hydrolase n=1 Tax=Nocardioides sp. Kera G14 TaxID=2884264 RepID=UPI001D121989|nr:alpha/beta hydrolase [Nocardioides sp. Kera G14]UDY22904.1 alpha/beta fold hydrolase [Nocardioides sp. Kera G14]